MSPAQGTGAILQDVLFTGRRLDRTARLLAAMEQPPQSEPREGWTRQEIFRTIDRLVVEVCEVTDFSDHSILLD